jgi:diacylglycerol kinase family enzyme
MQAKAVEVHLEAPQDLMIDGEVFHNIASLEIRILPSALVCTGPRNQ